MVRKVLRIEGGENDLSRPIPFDPVAREATRAEREQEIARWKAFFEGAQWTEFEIASL